MGGGGKERPQGMAETSHPLVLPVPHPNACLGAHRPWWSTLIFLPHGPKAVWKSRSQHLQLLCPHGAQFERLGLSLSSFGVNSACDSESFWRIHGEPPGASGSSRLVKHSFLFSSLWWVGISLGRCPCCYRFILLLRDSQEMAFQPEASLSGWGSLRAGGVRPLSLSWNPPNG